MTTPLETSEILIWLQSTNQKTNLLKEKLQETIKKYRLDQLVGYSRKSFLRRTYTCPFFNHSELGCPLPVEIKPYGCLAFNSHHLLIKASSKHCYSEKDLLLAREAEHQEFETQVNTYLKNKFGIWWDKLPLPYALIELWNLDISIEDLSASHGQ